MTKLSLVLALVGLSAGCKTEPAASKAPAASRARTSSEPVKTADPALPAAGALPAECADYKAGIDKLIACERLPQETRDTLKQAFEQTAATWARGSADGRAAIATTCRNAAESLRQVARACP